jgi:hypothetical protein
MLLIVFNKSVIKKKFKKIKELYKIFISVLNNFDSFSKTLIIIIFFYKKLVIQRIIMSEIFFFEDYRIIIYTKRY